METATLYDLYRKAARKLHNLEKDYKAASNKEYAYLAYTELNTQCGVLQDIRESLEALEPDNKYEVGKRCFDIWCEESDVPKVKGGKFGFWIPVERELPEIGERCIVTLNCGSVQVATFKSEGWNLFDYPGDVIAWMPRPEAYLHGGDDGTGRYAVDLHLWLRVRRGL